MKKIILIVLLFCSVAGIAQSPVKTNSSKNSGTKNTPGKYQPAQTQNMVSTMLHDTCINKQFSIVFYIVLDTITPNQPGYPGVGLATTPTLVSLMNSINDAFKPICVSFVNCTTIFIPNYIFGSRWRKNQTEPIVTASWYTDKTINVYLVDTLDLGYGNTEKEGYTYPPTPANLANPMKNVIVFEKKQTVQGNGAIMAHLLGHFFGLEHTHHEISNPGGSSQELVNGSNCATTGDGICDTEADSGNENVQHDANNQLYLFPVDNFMSYWVFRCRFSQQQYNLMAYNIITKRLYLH